ncbi:ATP-binding cassette domain-containing protein [Nocardia implantans]|uniref:ATP-binding cassette domain-containing protein n=1 Tax=Nocardia implantans TaxID=3108168 RepID=A0ABU6AWN0_9NOCA|nr:MULTISPECIES: ATP-binding cassette domain-containing protein [unclassified Nocardia]MBF6193957.1 ATP-binding cassette domain-containing protein [Nocardia beijingensis]MEA3529304.1 ATP-binding cassette domain-containing protein [Nocardia sp. CDC192]MEB3511890.1 ATP-binding cassette domain-containing protein [Nocardia sp. CDC186]
MSETTTLLRTERLSVRYGGVAANSDIDITVGAGEIVGLIGPNGAGKTTFVDAVTGFTDATGHVTLEGVALDRFGPHRRRRAGLARTWQAGELFGDLTVKQNLAVALQRTGLRSLLTDIVGRSAPPGETIEAALDLVGVPGVGGFRPTELTLGQQKLVGVARALVGGSRVVLLDEPAAGLDTHESTEFGQHLRRIAASGIGVLLIDHDMQLVLDICARLYVLDFGVVIASGEPARIREDPRVITAYLGTAAHGEDARPPATADRPAGENE